MYPVLTQLCNQIIELECVADSLTIGSPRYHVVTHQCAAAVVTDLCGRPEPRQHAEVPFSGSVVPSCGNDKQHKSLRQHREDKSDEQHAKLAVFGHMFVCVT